MPKLSPIIELDLVLEASRECRRYRDRSKVHWNVSRAVLRRLKVAALRSLIAEGVQQPATTLQAMEQAYPNNLLYAYKTCLNAQSMKRLAAELRVAL